MVRGELQFFRLMRGEDRGSCCPALPAWRFINSLRLTGLVGNLQQEIIRFSMTVIAAFVPSFSSSPIQMRLGWGGGRNQLPIISGRI